MYKDEYVVGDIMKYRAAAIAAARIEDLTRTWTERHPPVVALENLADDIYEDACPVGRWSELRGDFWDWRWLELMHRWRDLFSDTGESYRSLDRTLMNLPGGVPAGLVCRLSDTHLIRPVLERTQLVLVAHHATGNQRNGTVFHHARSGQIKEAMRRVAEHTHNDLSPKRARDIGVLVGFLIDYPDQHTGNIVGLADKAIRWHRAQPEPRTAALGSDAQAVPPPIPLPELPGVRFLASAGDIYNEGAEMGHCIAFYAEMAVRGECYLFHVEHDGESASVEVDCRGRVKQAFGPRNKKNKAAMWGWSVLSRWGASFPVMR